MVRRRDGEAGRVARFHRSDPADDRGDFSVHVADQQRLAPGDIVDISADHAAADHDTAGDIAATDHDTADDTSSADDDADRSTNDDDDRSGRRWRWLLTAAEPASPEIAPMLLARDPIGSPAEHQPGPWSAGRRMDRPDRRRASLRGIGREGRRRAIPQRRVSVVHG
ncbi:MAG TPA: hypothetical protein VK277_11895 [Acidimicrobiales bacterium]|nr:hypothetical protein [Acidimicrobiales bacterium]